MFKFLPDRMGDGGRNSFLLLSVSQRTPCFFLKGVNINSSSINPH